MPPTIAALFVFSFIDPQWAIPLNTLILFIISVDNRRNGRKAAVAAAVAVTTAKTAADTVGRVEQATGRVEDALKNGH